MRDLSFKIRKWTVRALVTVGAVIGLSSCHSTKNVTTTNPGFNPDKDAEIHNLVYGPPTDIRDKPKKIKKDAPEPQKTVYGPPFP